MGQILSISVNNEVKNAACQAVTIAERQRGMPVVKSASYINATDIGKLAEKRELRIACAYDGIIAESVDIPHVNNSKSKSFLLKNKMKEHLKKELEYSFAFFENPGKAEPPNVNYTVYAAPIYILKDNVNINPNNFGSVKSFTFDFFAVAGVSAIVDPIAPVFHVYADKDRIIMVLSIGTKVEYYRVNNVPPQVTTPEGLLSFYYENVNLTYLYVRQNFSSLKLKIILSGKLHGDTAFKDSLAAFIDQPIIPLSSKNIVLGASDKLFNEFLIPIGHSLLRGRLDFSSDKQRGDRLFLNIISVINVILLLGIFACGGYAYQRYLVYKDAHKNLDSKSRQFLNQQKDLISQIGDTQLLKYKSTYLRLLADRVNTPLLLLAPSQDIMNFYQFDRVVFEGKGENSKVTFAGEQQGSNFASIEEFKNQVQDIINTVASKNVTANEAGSVHSLKNLQSKLNVVVISNPELLNQRKKADETAVGSDKAAPSGPGTTNLGGAVAPANSNPDDMGGDIFGENPDENIIDTYSPRGGEAVNQSAAERLEGGVK